MPGCRARLTALLLLAALSLPAAVAVPAGGAAPAPPVSALLLRLLPAWGGRSWPAALAAVSARCPEAVPAAAAALAGSGPFAQAAVDAGAWSLLPHVAAAVLADCPAPAGPVAPAVQADLLAFLRSSDAQPGDPNWPAALRRDLSTATLYRELASLSEGGAALAGAALRLSATQTFSLILRLQGTPAAAGLEWDLPKASVAQLRAWFEAPALRDRTVRLRLLASMGWPPRPPADWAARAAAREPDPAIAEVLWAGAYASDPRRRDLLTYDRLVDRYGAFRLPGEDGPPFQPDWRTLRPAALADPGGYLARGIAAYEKVEGGRPYFQVDLCGGRAAYDCPWLYTYGDRQFAPAREIPGWRAFLARFPRHPAAADAAYRLARCYEIDGDWTQALHWMWLAATHYPDGVVAPAAWGRLLFILDVEAPTPALRRAAGSPLLVPALRAAVRYTLAVRELRAGEYAWAAPDLADHPPPALGWPQPSGTVPWPVALLAARQRQEAARLAALALRAFGPGVVGAGGTTAGRETWQGFPPVPPIRDPVAAYALGAILYHHELAPYNLLWSGRQQWFFWYPGQINALVRGDLTPTWVHGLRAMNAFVQAYPVFAAVAADPRAPAALRARALYSAGECLVHLDGFSVATDATAEDSVTRARIVATFRAFAARYRRYGGLAADALLTVARYTRAPADIAAVERRFPGTWQAKAAAALTGAPNGPSGGGVAGTFLPAPADLGFGPAPQVPVAPGGGSGSRLDRDGWTTLWVAPRGVAPGWGVEIRRVADAGSGRATVYWARVSPSAQPPIPWARYGPTVAVRVPARLTHVAFVEVAPL